jgi:hypothetical protein
VLLLDMKATLISLWLGNRTRTAAHCDMSQNFGGRGAVHALPDRAAAQLYVGPRLQLAGQPISMVDLDAPDMSSGWREMFDHGPEHRPEKARGFFGWRTPELVARVKKAVD